MLRTKRDAVFCDRVLENGANEYLLAKTGVDTAENEPLKVWRKIQSILHAPEEQLSRAPTHRQSLPAKRKMDLNCRQSLAIARFQDARLSVLCRDNKASSVPVPASMVRRLPLRHFYAHGIMQTATPPIWIREQSQN